jgi:hypothetical protein
MKTSAVVFAASLGASVAFAPVTSFNGANLVSTTRFSSNGPQMVLSKKKAEPAAPAKKSIVLKPSLPGKKAPAAPSKAVPAPVKKSIAAVKKAAAPIKKAAAPIKKAATSASAPVKKVATAIKKAAAPAPVANTDFAIAFGSDVEAPFWDPAQLAADKPAETIEWYRAAELKHGRIAMLAALGTFINAAGISLPDAPFQGTTKSFAALAQVAEQRPGALIQIVLAIAAVEALSVNLPEGQFPGDLGFDPANQIPVYEGKGTFDDLRLKELKNGRLAMIGIAGMWVQEALTGQGVFEQINSGHFSPVGDGQGYF